MFTEILRIKPVLDGAASKQMENNLSARFARVATRFRGGIMAALKGSILGVSLGLLNKLLNPIEALEDKIKSLLGQGSDIRDLADRFNTSPANIKRLQDVGSSLGVTPDKLNDMMTKYANAVEQAKQELENPFQERSPSTNAVKNFVGEKDLAEGFFQFLRSLNNERKGQGRDIFFGEEEQRKAAQRAADGKTLSEEERQRLTSQGLMKRITGEESSQDFQKTVFGEQLFGPEKRMMQADFFKQLFLLHQPAEDKVNQAVNKTATLADQQRLLQTRNATTDFMKGAGVVDSSMVQAMEAAQAKENERLNKQLQSYDDLRAAADGIEKLKGLLLDATTSLTKSAGYLGVIADWVEKAKGTKVWRGLFSGDW